MIKVNWKCIDLLEGIVTDGVEEVCVDSGEMGAILEAGGVRGPGPQEGERTDSWHRTVEEGRQCKIPKSTGDGLVTTSSHIYAQSMYHCMLCISYHINNHNRNRVLLYYLFQENKSFGSKTPFAFILWCTRSCVEHNFDLTFSTLHRLNVTLAWDFFVLVFCTDQTNIGQRIRLLSVFNFVLEFADLFKFFYIQRWLSWWVVSFPVNWVNAKWDSTSTELTQSETPRQLSQHGMMKSS
jgi:hypothetical protein